MSYQTKVYKEQGGDRETVVAGGSIKIGNAILTADAAGNVIVTGLSATNPNVAGALYNNAGVLTVSTGA